MKNCPQCGNRLNDDAVFCPFCGTRFTKEEGAPQQGHPQQQQAYAPQANVIMIAPYDHTREFDPQDISDNKVYCMVIYLLGTIGIIIGLLAAQSSRYVAFHARQALKFTVLSTLIALATAVLFWTVVVPVAALVAYAVLLVVRIICFVQICQGKAMEPAIVRNFGFLK